jgi:hypothetical protein
MVIVISREEGPVKYTVQRDYFPALRQSGTRRLAVIEWLVLHDMESTNLTGAAEGVGAWFRNSQVQASTHYGIDNNSIQQYLALTTIPWGAPGANLNGIHYEQMGKASWSREQWFDKAKPTLDRTAWLLAKNHNRLEAANVHVPLRALTDAELRDHKHGITTHRQLTRALGIGTHTDPGSGYPLAWVIERARHYAAR